MIRVILLIGTIGIEIITNYFITNWLQIEFWELAVFLGILFTFLIYFFTSKDGEIFSEYFNLMVRTEGSVIWTEERELTKERYSFNPLFLGSLIFTFVSFIGAIIKFWQYF